MGSSKINRRQLPIKAHFFFFMAAMGPILPFLTVYGKKLGVSPSVMGVITGILPFMFLIAKPSCGYLVDRFRTWSKTIFVSFVTATSACFVLMYILPTLPGPILPDDGLFYNVSCDSLTDCASMNLTITDSCADEGRRSLCTWQCRDAGNFTASMFFRVTEDDPRDAKLLRPNACFVGNNSANCLRVDNCTVDCDDSAHESECVYSSATFVGFVLLMSLGSIGYNVCNCITDAICFEVLGEGEEMSYGRQRVWGSIGFGIASLMAGYLVDLWVSSDAAKSYTPAFVLVFLFTAVDLVCCSKLVLPKMSSSESIVQDVWKLVQIKPIAIFLGFAVVAGVMDGFIIYFLFWYMEDLASETGYTHDIKFIEGLTVFAQTLGGEVLFFSYSGQILKKIGYSYSFVLCFAFYALRLGLISLASTPYWVVFFEFFMQGPTYALCYTTIVAYASVVAPPGTLATVQGIVAGIDDGLGFAIGSLIGGFLYKRYRGNITMRIFSAIALVTSITYLLIHLIILRNLSPETDTRKKTEWKSPEEAAETCVNANEK